ncbi:WYL domain-containing protein [Mycobacterium kansasii]|uniref:helix-turn-helix transcriptional regulator n=1 Tax=Mycobacterium kansasii TaxID=1768 RepID=UPI000CDD0575|nr:YafY family protein [Mycobacterium kansasii]POX99642.1 WYL domain-containing protein [Mycobacterium kansasii]POY23862.1 WYL domain-containing protein [Mycobacterium kansasii]POY30923.1 WYL domain-containing protein [Mycobacterium kansasii]
MATSKVERLVNLVIALLSTRGYITAEKIRSSVAGYSDSPTAEAFSRMFERDKNELRDLGIPLEVGKVSNLDPTEGYRINRDAYALPPVDLTPDEATAVAVATQLWESPELVTATQGALLKLRAAGVDVDPVDSEAAVTIASPAGLTGLRGSENVLGILLSAIDSRQAVQFRHRSSRAEPYTTRTVEPWGVVTERGRWYLVGHDRDRGATRVFRLSRISGEITPIGPAGAIAVPDDVDLRGIVAAKVTEAPTGMRATVWVAGGRATALRRAGQPVGPRRLAGRDGDVIELDIGSSDRLAREIAGYGADAIVLEPAILREDVLARLHAHAGAAR